MRSFALIILSLLPLTSACPFSLSDAKGVISFIEEPTGDRFEKLKGKTPFDNLLEKVLIDKIAEERGNIPENLKSTDNPYCILEIAKLLRERGAVEESKKFFRKVFESSNSFDEEVLLSYPGDRGELLTDKTLKKKVRMALRERDFDRASLLLDLLQGRGKEYELLRAKLLSRTGRREEAVSILRKLDTPEAYLLLIYLEREPGQKFKNLLKAVKSKLGRRRKILASRYLLDRFLIENPSYFRKTLRLVKRVDKNTYSEYLAKYYIRNSKFWMARKLLSGLKGEMFKAWKVAIERKFLNRREKLKSEKLSFYRFMLSGKPLNIRWREPEIDDIESEGVRYLVRNGYCTLLSLAGERGVKRIDLAVANYLCGNYRKAVRLAVAYRDRVREIPFLLPILYPKPELFGDDAVSLAIARQESLFDSSAVSRSGAIGLMQIMPETGRYLARKLNVDGFETAMLFDERFNYLLGSYYIGELMKITGYLPVAAASYNAGPTRVMRIARLVGPVKSPEDTVIFVDVLIPFEETRTYVKNVIRNYFIYSYMLRKKPVLSAF